MISHQGSREIFESPGGISVVMFHILMLGNICFEFDISFTNFSMYFNFISFMTLEMLIEICMEKTLIPMLLEV